MGFKKHQRVWDINASGMSLNIHKNIAIHKNIGNNILENKMIKNTENQSDCTKNIRNLMTKSSNFVKIIRQKICITKITIIVAMPDLDNEVP